MQAAASDGDFLGHAGRADRLRDIRRWEAAEYHYWRAIRLYPLHHGYIVQYAHMLKEQGKLPDAEYQYRNALALGAPVEDTAAHLRAVCARLGEPLLPPVPLRPEAAAFDLPPLGTDLEQLSELFFGHAVDRLLDILPIMRRAPTQGAAIEQMICSVRFANATRDLLELLGHRARTGGL
jgi:tetratricopeptide (TPR) repeat protein